MIDLMSTAQLTDRRGIRIIPPLPVLRASVARGVFLP